MARRYASALRAEQAGETRNRILAALAEQLAAGGEVSLPQVAARAGVSLRTLHNHFPDERSRVAALARWIDDTAGVLRDAPAAPEDVAAYAGRIVRAFFAHETLLRAQLAPGFPSEIRRARRAEREQRLRAVVGTVVPDPAAADRAAAMLAWIIGGQTAIALKDHAGLDPSAVERTLVWAVRVLMAALSRGDPP